MQLRTAIGQARRRFSTYSEMLSIVRSRLCLSELGSHSLRSLTAVRPALPTACLTEMSHAIADSNRPECRIVW